MFKDHLTQYLSPQTEGTGQGAGCKDHAFITEQLDTPG